MNKSLLWVFALAAFGASRADAAFITIDGSNLASITITAGDFEDGLGESAANTLPDASHTIPGSWIDEGAANGASLDVLFALAVLPTDVTSGITFDATSDGFFASLVGSLDGFTGGTYFSTALSTNLQNGQTVPGGVPFLSLSFRSEAARVPEPATLLLLGGGLALLLVRRRLRG